MKTPLILIHGFRGTNLGLKELGSYFDPKKYEVFIPTLPPFGKDAEVLPLYDPKNYAKFIADYIKLHNLKKPVLIGHSMGSVVVAATAERYPELLSDKIIFLAPISVKPSRPIANLQPLVTILPNKPIGYLTTQYMIIDRTNQKKILETTYACGEYFGDKKDLKNATKFSTNFCITDFDFPQKALFLAGAKDRLIARKKTEAAAKKYGAKTIFIPGTGHLLNYEKPAETAEIIDKFLSI